MKKFLTLAIRLLLTLAILILLLVYLVFPFLEERNFRNRASEYLQENGVEAKELACDYNPPNEYLLGGSGYCVLETKPDRIENILEKLSLNKPDCKDCIKSYFSEQKALDGCKELFESKSISATLIFREQYHFINAAFYNKDFGLICFCYQEAAFGPG